ncbi:ABC transporter ATP-binding protein [Agrococcus sp. ARC_14]|uniref:ABC transporter ATP-binding protein n=1 Tax=Agrococcus sp. ARC_14 TaxID=2919927 RepID=UPI001F06D209|nr:ABC transporter ATP-binding protein [Agrococcus sp. ARC_14]MCH1883793.1 ABC transporter ATP-binding protein/permease [Agrococcus sp. ARC_14]
MSRGGLPRPIERGRIGSFVLLVAIGVGQAVGAIGLAMLVQLAFEVIVTSWASPDPADDPDAARLIGVVALLGGAVAITAICRAAERSVAERMGQHYVQQVRDRLFRHLTRVPARVLGRKASGSLLLRFAGDLSALRSWVSLGLARLVVSGVAVVLVLAVLVTIAPRLTAAVTVALLTGTICTIAVGMSLADASRSARNRQARLSGEVAERLTNVGVLQASGQELRERRRIGRKGALVASAMIRQARAAGTARGVAEATGGIATIAVLIAGALDVRMGDTSPAAIVGAITVVGFLATHLRDLGRVAEYHARAGVARQAAIRFLQLEPLPDPAGQPELPDGPGVLELRGVALEPGLRGVTARAEAGQTVAVVGGNGAGKSTLGTIAARLVDPESGAVVLDGADLRGVRLRSVRRAIGVVGPDLPLMRGTLERNVRYRIPRASDEEVARIAAVTGVDALADELADGWDSDVGESGRRLSAGQRTRVALARAMLGDPRILVLDEADAHLDAQTRETLRGVVRGRPGTTIVITHDADMVASADVVWHLDAGRLVEVGAPHALLTGDGPTARLFGGAQARPPLPQRVTAR